MLKAFDLTETRILLRRMVDKGYLTVEDLDTPSMGWRDNAKRFRLHYPNYQQPVYVNPLREPELAETVQVSDPRDFTPPTGATPTQEPQLPLADPPLLTTEEVWDF